MGLDPSKPLDEQIVNEETKQTWADDFIDTAIENESNQIRMPSDAMMTLGVKINDTIVIDGEKDSAWKYTKPIDINRVRKQYLFNNAKTNSKPATGEVSVMFNESKLYLYAEIKDNTNLTISANSKGLVFE